MLTLDVVEVTEVQGQAVANELLKEGWTLLAVVSGQDTRPWYILGKKGTPTRESAES